MRTSILYYNNPVVITKVSITDNNYISVPIVTQVRIEHEDGSDQWVVLDDLIFLEHSEEMV